MAPNGPAAKAARKADEKSDADLPPPRTGDAINKAAASLPLMNTSMSTVVYAISVVMIVYLAYYAYLVLQWKTDAGGWFNLAFGTTPPSPNSDSIPFGGSFKNSRGQAPNSGAAPARLLEDRISELAEQLAIEPTSLASAIKPLLDPTKASVLYEEPHATGALVSILTEDAKAHAAAAAELDKGGILGKLVGDDPPAEAEAHGEA